MVYSEANNLSETLTG